MEKEIKRRNDRLLRDGRQREKRERENKKGGEKQREKVFGWVCEESSEPIGISS
jgi:hypothetical protein